MPLSYTEWKELAITTYDVVSLNYNRKVYEAVVPNDQTKEMEFVQLTLREVLTKCEGTIFEKHIKQAVMKCVYTEAVLEKEIRPVMNLYYKIN